MRKCRRTVGISIWLRTVGIRIQFITVAISIRFITVSTLSFFLDLVNILQLPCCGRPFSTASAAGSSRGEEALHSKSVYASLGPC